MDRAMSSAPKLEHYGAGQNYIFSTMIWVTGAPDDARNADADVRSRAT